MDILKKSLSSDSQSAIEMLQKQHADELKRLREEHEQYIKNLNANFEKRVT